MPSRVSVIIPAFNASQFIELAILSVLGQTITNIEIFIIDDGSTDNTAEIADRFKDSIKCITQVNAGVSVARNNGVTQSTGEYLAFLDADDIWEPTKLEKQLAVFESDPEIGLVHCGMRDFDSETGETLALQTEGKSGWVADDLLLWDEPVINGPGCTIMVKREVFEAVNGFDTNIKVGEDWDFCYRVARKYKVGFAPDPLVNYRIHSGGAHRNVENMEKGMGRFYEKAFDTDDPNIHALKTRAMSNYHRTLSGSYLYTGEYFRSVKHAIKSIVYRPSSIGYFLKFPLRRFGYKH